MKSVTVVCDNHPERPAVASWNIVRLARPGSRPIFPSLECLGPSRPVDLCEECAAVLGWQPPPPPPDPEPITEPQRRLLFARFRELDLLEEEWRDLLEDVTGQRSMRAVTLGDVDGIMDRLDAEAVRRA